MREEKTKRKLGQLVERIAFSRRGQVALSGKGVGDAPIVIAVVLDPVKDPHHWVEAGTAQNMALMAHSLGLASYWAGLGGKSEAEARRIRATLDRDVLGGETTWTARLISRERGDVTIPPGVAGPKEAQDPPESVGTTGV